MKIHSFIREILTFSFILLLFLLPPVIKSFVQQGEIVLQWSFPLVNFAYFVFALLLYTIYKEKAEFENTFFFVYKEVVPFTLCFGSLLTVSLIFKFLANVLSNVVSNQVIFPDNFISWLYCILSFGFAAFYEEVLYRFYTPEILKVLLGKIKSDKVIFILSELFALIIFSLAHYYMGLFSVFNAFIAHIILRLCYKKCDSIIPGFLAHFFYNIVSLILL